MKIQKRVDKPSSDKLVRTQQTKYMTKTNKIYDQDNKKNKTNKIYDKDKHNI